jgi:hypothetical protein
MPMPGIVGSNPCFANPRQQRGDTVAAAACGTARAVPHIIDDPARCAIKFDPSQPASSQIGSCLNGERKEDGLLSQPCVEQSRLRQRGNGMVLELSLSEPF